MERLNANSTWRLLIPASNRGRVVQLDAFHYLPNTRVCPFSAISSLADVHVVPTKAVSHVCACDRDLLWSSCPPVLAPIMIRFGLLLHSPPYPGEDQCDCQGRHTTSNDANIKRVEKQVWANLWFCANTSRISGLWCVHSAVMKCAPPPAECSSSCSCTVLLLLLLVLLLLLLIQLSTRPAPALRRTDEPPLHDKLSSHCIVHTVQYTISNESLHCSMFTFQSIAHCDPKIVHNTMLGLLSKWTSALHICT